jgi:hypothetical protein
MEKRIILSDLWVKEFTIVGNDGYKHCALCGNKGIIDTSGMKISTATGYELGPIKTFCICPNGRAMKEAK